MSRARITKTSFTAGELSAELLGRGDLKAYENGASKLTNVSILPTGGVSRRAGLYFCDKARGDGRLISFEFNTEQTYLLCFSNGYMDVLKDGAVIASYASPWNTEQLKNITWTQSADTLLICHPDISPKKITRSSDTIWSISNWDFYENNNINYQPYYKFVSYDITLKPNGTSGDITLTASKAVFNSGHVGTRLKVGGKQVVINTVASPTVVNVTTKEDLSSTDATKDWKEQAFSAVRGYPISVAFHQDRLVIGGSKSLPNRLWLSKSGDLWNFDLGEGLDDESIEFSILSDQVNAIRAVFSGRHLQVFTSGAEWMVQGNPLTPKSIQLYRQTRVGSLVNRYVPPVDVDGATMFVSRNGSDLREFVYTDLEQAYQANDLALVSKHLLVNPVDMDFDVKNRLLFNVLENGKVSVLTIYRNQSIAAWSSYETEGKFKSVSVVGDNVYFLIERNGSYFIEKMDESENLDSCLSGESETAKTTWSGLNHLIGREVVVVADGTVLEDTYIVPVDGTITLPNPVSKISVGMEYKHIIAPLPVNTSSNIGMGRAIRLVDVVFRLYNTYSLKVDCNRGIKDIPLRDSFSLNSAPQSFSGDIKVKSFGWKKDATTPLWRIEQSTPFNFTLLSATTQIKIND
ncbi:MAG: hypothetical protein N4A43_00610 [Alphaproteobacteria bacterium]|jgi:hypothetical protein|nr:hypothetical protein [Alphaproteobacteria bacterium]